MDNVKKKRKSMSDKYDSDGLPYDQVDKEDNPNGKKRFVWPESLHKDFIAAVFDIGLKVASKDEILELLPKHISPHHPSFQCIHELRPEQIRAQIDRIKLFRVRKPGVYLSHYDAYLQSMKRHGPTFPTATSQQALAWMDSNTSRNGNTGEFQDANYYNSSNNLRVARSATLPSSSASSSYIDPILFDLSFDNDIGRKALTQAFQNLTADMTTMSTVIGQQSSLVNDFNKSIKSQRTVLEDLNRKWSALKSVVDAQSAQDEVCRASSSQYNNMSSSNNNNSSGVNMSRGKSSMSNEGGTSSATSSYTPYMFGDQDEADIIIGMNKVADANRRPYESDRGVFIEPGSRRQQQQPRHSAPAPSGHHQMGMRQSAGNTTTTNNNNDMAAGSMSRRELSMMSEMRVQMNIHRQLLMKKRNQILLHSSDDYCDTSSNNDNRNSSVYRGGGNQAAAVQGSNDGHGDPYWAVRFPSTPLYHNSHSSSGLNNPEPHGYQHQQMQMQSATTNDTDSRSRVPPLPDPVEILMGPPSAGLRAIDPVWDLDMPSATTTIGLPDSFLSDFNPEDQNEQNDNDLFSFLNAGLWGDSLPTSQPPDQNNSSTTYSASGENFPEFYSI